MHSAKCQTCGKGFESNYTGRKFCSRECYSRHLASIKPDEPMVSSPKQARNLEHDLTKEISRLTIENARLAGVKEFTEEEQDRRDRLHYQKGYDKAESYYKQEILELEKKQREELEARPVRIETKIEYKDRVIEKIVPKVEYVDRIEYKTFTKHESSWLSFKEDVMNSFGLILVIVVLAIAAFAIYELFPLILKALGSVRL